MKRQPSQKLELPKGNGSSERGPRGKQRGAPVEAAPASL